MKHKLYLFLLFTFFLRSVNGQTDTLPITKAIDTLFSNTLDYECEDFSADLQIPTETITEIPQISLSTNSDEEPNHTDRLVYWLHGLGGSAQSWAAAASVSEDINNGIADYPARRIESEIPSYVDAQTVNLFHAAEQVESQIEILTQAYENRADTDPDYDRRQGILIAHSQGGVVGRQIDLNYVEHPADKAFGGIVTFGTPHAGAFIATDSSEHLVFSLASDLCVALAEPSVLEVIEPSFLGDIIANKLLKDLTLEEFITSGCDFLTNSGLPLVLGAQQQNTRLDYTPNSNRLAILKAHDESDNDVPNKVAFYGVEEEPVIWNTVHSLNNKPDLLPPSKTFQADDGNEDCDAEDAATTCFANRQKDKAMLKFMEWSEIFENQYNRGNLGGHFCNLPVLSSGVCVDEARRIRDSWARAFNFWDTANEKYKIAIGALKLEFVEGESICLCQDAQQPLTYEAFLGSCGDNVPDGYINCNTIKATRTINKIEHESDGVVLANSAMDYEGAEKVKMQGSNHQQMRNDENTKVGLFRLWEGEYGPFFLTEEKNN